MIAGGGTAGHIVPALAIGRAIHAIAPDTRLVCVGAERPIDHIMFEREALPVHYLPRVALPRGVRLAWLTFPFRFLRILSRARYIVRRERPDVVVSTGGYVGGIITIAARLARVPVVQQEQNAVAGKSARLASRWAARIYNVSRGDGVITIAPDSIRGPFPVGNPVLAAVSGPVDSTGKERDLLLVTGGSQGALGLNRPVADMLLATDASREPVYWQCGQTQFDELRARIDAALRHNVTLVSFSAEMPERLTHARLAIGRSGALSLEEFARAGTPSILVPLPSAAQNEQRANARSAAAHGSAVVVEQAQLTGARLARITRALLSAPGVLADMQHAAYRNRSIGAAWSIAEDTLSLISSPNATR